MQLNGVVKTFNYNCQKYNYDINIKYDVLIPLLDYNNFDYLFGNLIAQNHLPLPLHKDVNVMFQKFLVTETQNYFDKLLENELINALENNEELDSSHILTKLNNNNIKESAVLKEKVNNINIDFEECFQHVIKNSTIEQLAQIVKEELEMSEKMLTLIRARDFEIERLTKLSELTSEDTTNTTQIIANQIDNNDHGYKLTMINEKLKQVKTNYYYQIKNLRESQKHSYRQFIYAIFNASKGNKIDDRQKKLNTRTKVYSERYGNIKKSFSCNLKIQTNFCKDESFTIYIGAQMKTMHNARILLCNNLTDLCQSNSLISESFYSNSIETNDNFEKLFNSHRLQLLMSLYRHELTSVVLIVGSDPQFHLKNNTLFNKICEQSSELHFDSLKDQLRDLAQEVKKVNKLRENLNKQKIKNTTLTSSTDTEKLQPGDVYVTCHSNLSSAQVIFHLVTDNLLETSDISSRHPCIIGFHNIIYTASRCGIRNISFPLLLVEKMTETMTFSWCLARAELLFKCVKGFLMEICSTDNAMSSTAAGFPSLSVTDNISSATRYNVNFAIPSKISLNLFNQIVDLFSNIFHLVPSLTA